MLRITEIKLPVDHAEKEIRLEILRILSINDSELAAFHIVKQSLDARKKNKIFFAYTIEAEVANEQEALKKINRLNVTKSTAVKYQYDIGNVRGLHRPVIIGTGPAGLFSGLVLAMAGCAPILLERGKSVDDRVLDVDHFLKNRILNPDSNVQFGEGGAGTFSDGKLTTQIKDPRCSKVLEDFVAAGAPEEILFKNKPHIGTDLLRRVIIKLRERIISLGGEFRFSSCVTGFSIEDNRITGVKVNRESSLLTDKVILAIGNSARDTFKTLLDAGIELQQKPFSIGVRIEHPQKLIDHIQFGRFAGNPRLGPAEYKLVHHGSNNRSVYTFCMCPGGSVISATTEEGCVATNGMSENARNKLNANSAVLVGIGPDDFGSSHPLAGMEFQRQWERKAFQSGGGGYSAPAQCLGDFLKGRVSKEIKGVLPTYLPGITKADLRSCLPDYVYDAIKQAIPEFDKKLKGFALPDAVLTGVETRSSCPVRIVRNANFESNIRGLYPTGEGAGYAGGIISSAVDGIKVAEAMTGGGRKN